MRENGCLNFKLAARVGGEFLLRDHDLSNT